ncbi:MAG: hypothetical protein HYY13_04220 [Nitrospirae bacterium]|nr:hypothetical protein [Nitrospirota bacterium]
MGVGACTAAITLILAGCSKSLDATAPVPEHRDGVFRVGASKIEIMPVPYGEDGSCPQGKFCFELPIHFSDELGPPSLPYPAKPEAGVTNGCWEWKASEENHRKRKRDEWYEGLLDNPAPDPASCREGFVDANGNGKFEALWMGGYDQGRPATSIDPVSSIYVKVMVMQRDDQIAAVVGLPFVGFPTLQLAALRERLAAATGGKIARENVILYVQHNHSLPDPQGLWGPDILRNFDLKGPSGESLGDFFKIPGLDFQFPIGSMNFHNFPYWMWVEDRAAEALGQALKALEPVKMRFGEREQPHREIGCLTKDFSAHADFTDPDGNGLLNAEFDCDGDGVANADGDRGIIAKGSIGAGESCLTPVMLAQKPGRFLMGDSRLPYVVDNNVYTWQFVREDRPNETVASFVVWGAHVEAGPGANTRLTGDYAEYICNFVEKQAGGICMFQIGPQGGLTGPLGTAIFKVDDVGRYFDCNGNVIPGSEAQDDALKLVEGGRELALVVNGPKHKDGGMNVERMESLGYQIAKTGLAAIQGQEPHEVKGFSVATQYTLIPLDNPGLYLFGRLEILGGFSLVLRRGFEFGKIKELVYADELPSNRGGVISNQACGPVLCIRTPINLVTVSAQSPGGTLRKIGWLTNPGEMFPEWMMGRAGTEVEFRETDPGRAFELKDMAATGLDPEFPSDLFTTQINPQHYMPIRGLNTVAREDAGYHLFFATAQTQSSLGYQPPQSEFMLVYEGLLDDVEGFAAAIDLVLKFNGGVHKVFRLSDSDRNLTFKEVIDESKARYGDRLKNFSRPVSAAPRRHGEAGGHNLIGHPNAYEEEVSPGPRTGLIIYNASYGLITKSKYEPFYPMPRGDPNTDAEVRNLPKFAE